MQTKSYPKEKEGLKEQAKALSEMADNAMRNYEQALRTGLSHYNGYVMGKNTPNCHTYPTKVKKYVESQDSSICANKSFYDCIAKPFVPAGT